MKFVSNSSLAVFLLWLGCSAALGADVVPGQAGQKNPVPNKAQGAGGFTQDEEIAIGRQLAGNLLGAVPLVRDNSLQKYVNNVGGWLARQSERPELPWHFGVIDSSEVYSLSTPGGYVFVTRGLYILLQSEAELAGVLAHEISHVVRKHGLQLLPQKRVAETGGNLLAREGGGGNNQVQAIIGNGAEIIARALDHDAEFAADRMGVVLAARAGYDPFGLPAALQEIGGIANDEPTVALLRKTHPAPEVRLERLGVAMGDRFDSVRGAALEDRLYRIKQ